MGINSVNSQMRGLGTLQATINVVLPAIAQQWKSDNLYVASQKFEAFKAEYPNSLDIANAYYQNAVRKIEELFSSGAYQASGAINKLDDELNDTLRQAKAMARNGAVAPAAPAASAVLPAVAPLPAFQIKEDAPQRRTTPAPLTAAQLEAIKAKEDQKKMLMYGGIGVGVLVLLGGIWYLTKD